MRLPKDEQIMLDIVKGPYLQWPTQNSMTIMWETSSPASSKVTYAEVRRVHSGLNGRFETVKSSQKSVEDPTPCQVHAVTLTGLAPDTTYHYNVSSVDSQGEVVERGVFPLKTAVHPNGPFSFAVVSENGGAGDTSSNQRLFTQIEQYRPEFLLIVGDAVNHGSVYEDWDRTLFAPGHALFTDTPFYLCLGNHEECSPWFYRFVAYPEPKNYYSFDYGNAHIVALDSTTEGDYEDGRIVATEAGKGFMPGSPQYEFLVRDLQSTRATWKFVFFHYPPYVSGDYQVEEMRVLCPVFEEHGVDIVFNSHTIVYERSHPLRDGRVDLDTGVVYVVVGGAGAHPHWFHHKRAWHTAQALAVPHFVQVVIAKNTLEMRAIDDEGRLFDRMGLTKARTG